MLQQSNALRRLEETLTEAVTEGDRKQLSGPILLKAMKLSEQPQNIVDFYELLNKAEEEARSIRNKPKIDRYLQTLEELHQVFVVNHVWGIQWNTFAAHIENKGVLNTLDALADFFSSQDPAIFLQQDFLEKLNGEFRGLLEEILESSLCRELKNLLVDRIEDILKAIRRYHIEGTKGLEKVTKALVCDLVMTEPSLKDKNNPTFKHVTAWVLNLLVYITPSPYDIIGAVPDIHDFWKPTFEELVANREKVEQIICEAPTIQEALKKTSTTFARQPQKSITSGKELKALPASKEELEDTTDN